MEDDCDDDFDGYDEDDYDFDEADFNQHLADKFDDLDLPPGVEATVPWLQKTTPKEDVKEPPKSNTADENANKYTQFKQFDTVQNFSDHYYAKNSHGEVRCSTSMCSCFLLCLGAYLFFHVYIVSAKQSLVKESST